MRVYLLNALMLSYSMAAMAQFESSIRNFTWEGALSGNKAVWNADDSLNHYELLNQEISVYLNDPLHLNTTTKHPSEFGDYTETNTFYGRGNFALQITSNKSGETACLEFSFKSPILLDSFNIFDIDFKGNAPKTESTYQDSVTIFGFLDGVGTKMNLKPLHKNTALILKGNTIYSNYIQDVNGDLSFLDSLAAISISSGNTPINKFIICYSNGSLDDGLSNSHAINLTDLKYRDLFGAVSGFVYEDGTNIPIPNSLLYLQKSNGEYYFDGEGNPRFYVTGKDGYYEFNELILTDYMITNVPPTGWEEVRDVTGINDGVNNTKINIVFRVSPNNNFYLRQATVLPIELISFDAEIVNSDWILTQWEVSSESNVAKYAVSVSKDEDAFIDMGEVDAFNVSHESKYSLKIPNLPVKNLFIRLSEVDFDGKITHLEIKKVTNKDFGKQRVINTLVNQEIQLDLGEASGDTEIRIYDMGGRLLQHDMISSSGIVVMQVNNLPTGDYVCQMLRGKDVTSTKIFKSEFGY